MGFQKKYNVDDFIARARGVHGDDYEYDKNSYISMAKKVKIYCKKHDLWFEQNPQKHVAGQGCPKCRYEKSSASKTYTPQEWEAKAKRIHGNKYKYYGDYTSNHEKVKIYCPVLHEDGTPHGDFYMLPVNHTHGTKPQGCPICGRIKCSTNRMYTKEAFIERAKRLNGNTYDYSQVVYKGQSIKVEIICPKHGSFWQEPGNHLQGQGCPKCKASKLEKIVRWYLNKNNIVYIEQYKFPSILPINWSVDFFIPNKNIAIECQGIQHFLPTQWGEHSQELVDELQKRDKEKQDLLLQKGIKTLYFSNLKIDYPYEICTTEECLITKIKEAQEVTPSYYSSIHTLELYSFIKSLGFNGLEMNATNIVTNESVSVVIPHLHIAFDILDLTVSHGGYHEMTWCKRRREFALEKGYTLIQIFEDEWVNKKDLVMCRVKDLLGIHENVISAEKCEIKEITPIRYTQFLTSNHLDGNRDASIRYGLYYEDELISLMSFAKAKKKDNKLGDNQYELIRYAIQSNTYIINGISILLNHFINTLSPSSIIAYGNNRWMNQQFYLSLGFLPICTSQINCFYTDGENRIDRNRYTKERLVNQGCDSNNSLHDILLGMGIHKIYDCGGTLYQLIP